MFYKYNFKYLPLYNYFLFKIKFKNYPNYKTKNKK